MSRPNSGDSSLLSRPALMVPTSRRPPSSDPALRAASIGPVCSTRVSGDGAGAGCTSGAWPGGPGRWRSREVGPGSSCRHCRPRGAGCRRSGPESDRRRGSQIRGSSSRIRSRDREGGARVGCDSRRGASPWLPAQTNRRAALPIAPANASERGPLPGRCGVRVAARSHRPIFPLPLPLFHAPARGARPEAGSA